MYLLISPLDLNPNPDPNKCSFKFQTESTQRRAGSGAGPAHPLLVVSPADILSGTENQCYLIPALDFDILASLHSRLHSPLTVSPCVTECHQARG